MKKLIILLILTKLGQTCAMEQDIFAGLDNIEDKVAIEEFKEQPKKRIKLEILKENKNPFDSVPKEIIQSHILAEFLAPAKSLGSSIQNLQTILSFKNSCTKFKEIVFSNADNIAQAVFKNAKNQVSKFDRIVSILNKVYILSRTT